MLLLLVELGPSMVDAFTALLASADGAYAPIAAPAPVHGPEMTAANATRGINHNPGVVLAATWSGFEGHAIMSSSLFGVQHMHVCKSAV
jgi:hypothetical protein